MTVTNNLYPSGLTLDLVNRPTLGYDLPRHLIVVTRPGVHLAYRPQPTTTGEMDYVNSSRAVEAKFGDLFFACLDTDIYVDNNSYMVVYKEKDENVEAIRD